MQPVRGPAQAPRQKPESVSERDVCYVDRPVWEFDYITADLKRFMYQFFLLRRASSWCSSPTTALNRGRGTWASSPGWASM